VGQEPLYYNSNNTGRPPAGTDLTHPPSNIEERYVSRYIDEQNAPQFPFGYGLSYTTFSYGATKVSADHLSAGELNRALTANNPPALTVEADISNAGSRAANEVVELYVRLQGTSTEQPVRALKGFQTVSLAAGETKAVKFELPAESFAIWNDRNQFAVEPSKLTVWIAPDSAHGTPAQADIVP
jgi:beta-glucosidase